MTIKKHIHLLILFSSLILLQSCLGGAGGKKKASCGEGQEFDSVSRSCKGAIVVESPPKLTLNSTSVSEDSGTSTITLTYADPNNDKATSCSVRSLSGDGIVKRLTLQNLIFESRSTVSQPQNVYVQFVNTGALSVSVSTLGLNSFITVNINEGTTTNFNVKTAVEGDGDTDCSDGDASCLISNAYFVFGQNAASFSTPVNLTELQCSCAGGVCTTNVTPVDNWFGTSEFEYQLTDNDGATSYQLVTLNVSSVNDAPTITAGAATLNVTEDTLQSGTLATDAGFTVSDTNDGDPTGALLTYDLINAPDYATFSLSSMGTYSILPNTDYTGPDSFIFRVCDSGGLCSNNQTITISITGVADAPVGTTATVGASAFTTLTEGLRANEPTNDTVTLNYTDAESDLATSCAVTTTYKVYVSTDCSCTLGVCTVGITGLGHETGAGYFDYTVTTAVAPTTSVATRVNVTITGAADKPHIFTTASSGSNIDADGNIYFTESTSHVDTAKSFVLNSALDPDSHSILRYEVVSPPANGTLANCMGLNGSSDTDIDCEYTPVDGNLNNGFAGVPTKATTVIGDLTFTAKAFGTDANGRTVEMIDSEGIAGNEYAWVEDGNVKIVYEDGVSTTANLATLINTTTTNDVKDMISATVTGGAVQVGGGTGIMAGGVAVADSFTYRAVEVDSVLDATDGQTTITRSVPVVIIPAADSPAICEYSNVNAAPECGVGGCIGTGAPSNYWPTPNSSGLFYYDKLTGSCWNSSASAWSLVESNVSNHSINELETLIIDEIVFDEGGGDTSEDAETLSIDTISSSNVVLIPLSNIKFYKSGVQLLDTDTDCDSIADAAADGTIPLCDGASSADTLNYQVRITPTFGQTGTSTLSFRINDSGGQTRTVTFTVTVNANSSSHGGWKNLMGLGPKIDKFNQVQGQDYSCSFSPTFCSNAACKGTSSPSGVVTPDDIDAVYYDSTNKTCYRINESVVKVAVQNIDYYPRRSSGASIEYTTGGTAGSEVVTVSGTAISVKIQDGVSTANQIITAIRASYQSNYLVEVETASGASAQSSQAVTTISGFTSSNWMSFNSYCNISLSSDETACSTYGSACMGSGAPVSSPTHADSFYYDRTNGTCYYSQDTNADNTVDAWATFTAPGYAKLEWGGFSISGSGSISGYNVYRRAAGGSFNYDRPVNTSVISTSSLIFEDKVGNSISPPAPKKLYFYEVRPIINSIPTDTDDAFTTARIFIPPTNTAFVHRWIVNQDMCDKLNASTDSANHFRCSYSGPGDSGAAPGSGFYDIGKDLIVDRYELGCPYTDNNDFPCSTTDGSCIGIQSPITGSITASDGAIYYDRTEAICYERKSSAWVPVSGRFTYQYHLNTPKLPPLVNVTSREVDFICEGLQSNNSYGTAASLHGYNTSFDVKLPSRQEQLAYSLWDLDNNSDTEVSTLETGLSINSSSKCNSSAASGLETSYTDINIPDSTNFFSLPGTATSGLKTMMTGSTKTDLCQSRFGVQDSIGNVGEWTTDRVTCSSLSTCSSVINGEGVALANTTNVMRAADGSDLFDRWRMDGTIGPCVDADSDGTCDSELTSWAYEDERFDGGRFMIPMGLPVHTDFPLNNPSSLIDTFMSEIGPTSGITSSQLHDDTFIVNSGQIYMDQNTCGSILTGGKHDTGNGAGSWSIEFTPCEVLNTNYASGTGFYTKTLHDKIAPTITFANGAGAISVVVAADYSSVTINYQTGVSTHTQIASAVNGDGDDDCTDGDASCLISMELTDPAIGATVFATVGGAVPSAANFGYRTIGQMSVKSRKAYTTSPTLTIIDPAALNGAITVVTAGSSVTVTLAHNGTSVTSTFANVVAAINGDNDDDCTDGDGSCFFVATVTGTGANTAGALSSTSLTDSTSSPRQNDIGGRCVIPLDYSNYTE